MSHATYPIFQLPKVNDSQYPPQRKSFSMLAYYNDYQIENYDWFMRMDDDSVLQWDNLNEFLERGYFFVGLQSMKSLLSYCFYVTMVLKMVLVSFFIRDYYDRSVNKYARSDLRYIVPSTEQ